MYHKVLEDCFEMPKASDVSKAFKIISAVGPQTFSKKPSVNRKSMSGKPAKSEEAYQETRALEQV